MARPLSTMQCPSQAGYSPHSWSDQPLLVVQNSYLDVAVSLVSSPHPCPPGQNASLFRNRVFADIIS